MANPSRTFFVLLSSSFINTVTFVLYENLCEGKQCIYPVTDDYSWPTHAQKALRTPASNPLLSLLSQHTLSQTLKFLPQKVKGGRRSNARDPYWISLQIEKEDAKDPPKGAGSIFLLMSEQGCRASPRPEIPLGWTQLQSRASKVLLRLHMSFPKAQ